MSKGQRMQHFFDLMVQDPKIAGAVGGTTVAVGMSSKLDVINGWLALIAGVLGIVLTLTLLFIHWRRHRREERRFHLEMKEVMRREAEREAIRRHRVTHGESLRRSDD